MNLTKVGQNKGERLSLIKVYASNNDVNGIIFGTVAVAIIRSENIK